MYTATPSSRSPESATNLTPRAIFVISIAVVLAGAVYVSALDNPFVYDDYRIVVENRSLNDLSNIRAVLWHEVTRPVVNISYAVDRALWGAGPVGFHVTNVLLHMLNVALFGVLSWRVAQDLAGRHVHGESSPQPEAMVTVAVLLFAVHPMLTEAVGYISGRSEVICGTFFLLALLSARRWMTDGRGWSLGLAMVWWGLALGSKEIAAMLPFVMLAYDHWVMPVDAATHRRRILRLQLPMLAIASVLVAIRLFVFLAVEHGGDVEAQWRFLLVESEVTRRYLTMLLLPTGQAIFHGISPIAGLADPRGWLGLATVVLLAGLAWMQRRAHPQIAFGLVWFLLLLAPSAALVVLDRGEPMAEHRVYLASAGIFLCVGSVAGHLWQRLSARHTASLLLRLALVVMVAALAGRTVVRNAVWASPTLVWLEAAEQAPDQWFPHLLLGEELHRAGRHDQAIAAFRRVISLRPQEAAAYGKLGLCLSEHGDLDAAEDAFTKLKGLDSRSTEASNGLATVALLRGQTDEAKRGYLNTMALDALNIAARRGMVVLEETAGHPSEALRWCEEIRQIAPDTPGNDECIRRNQARLAGRDDGR